jgi:GT2 family glycosyltransferase
MAVDVVVVNYKTYPELEQFCSSWLAHKFDGCTLTVVDVEGKSRLGDSVRVHHQIDRWINTEENCGYGRACNFGAAQGDNDVILLANADTLLSEDFRDCYDALIGIPEWGVLGPRQVNDQNQITAGGIIGTERNIGQRGWMETDHGQYSMVTTDAKSVSGALYFIKRSVWDELIACPLGPGTGFLETPHYFDETFCSYHVRAHGYKTVYYGPAKMIHLWHRASPHGGWADNQFNTSQQMMREACAKHNLECE